MVETGKMREMAARYVRPGDLIAHGTGWATVVHIDYVSSHSTGAGKPGRHFLTIAEDDPRPLHLIYSHDEELMVRRPVRVGPGDQPEDGGSE